MYKIGVIGELSDVIGFTAVGFSVFTADSPEEAHKILIKLAADGYAVIYITEKFAVANAELIARYRSSPLPAIIAFPGRDGSSGYGVDNIKKSVEKAVGADILFKS